jgi:two-component system, OmpR family, phosphate regulon sensor histidine kinase PhoR
VKGSGLGLSLVRHIARAHGGDVLVESHPQKGSRFTIALPLAFPSQAGSGVA